jgi:hypothetical protein
MPILSRVLAPNGALANEAQTFLGADSLFTTGNVFFVCSVTGSNDNAGTDPGAPKATLQGAISVCTANKGDKIVVMPGHAETVTSTSINLSTAGISVICLGTGLERPTFTYSTAAATITVSAANCAFLGGHHLANELDVASAFTIGAAKDFKLLNNTFTNGSASLNFLSVVTTGATANSADRLEVGGNYYHNLNTSPLAFISILSTIVGLYVHDNDVVSASTADVGHFITFADKNGTGTRIVNNSLIVVGATGAAVGIFLTGSGTAHTGIMAGNFVSSLDTTSELIITAGTGISQFENYYTGTADTSAKLWPVVDGA